ncbi:MAG: hypothetical protein NTW80_10170 [Deltaproteobacteria bacterium]|nr:hypothetical protein [Deltaproteobacteria bacterium]
MASFLTGTDWPHAKAQSKDIKSQHLVDLAAEGNNVEKTVFPFSVVIMVDIFYLYNSFKHLS